MKEVYNIILRYVILVLVAIPNLWIFYFILTPLTVYPVYFLFHLFFDAFLVGNNIVLVEEFPIQLIEACIAGSAYYILLILNLSIPKIKPFIRFKMIFFSLISLLLINIIRIFFLGYLAISGISFFDIAHKLFWYSLSIVFVTGIWFTQVKLFKIKLIPFYSDLKFLYERSKFVVH